MNKLSDGSTWVTHPWVVEGSTRVRFGVDGGGPQGDWPALLDWAQTVENLGFDSFWINDHTACSLARLLDGVSRGRCADTPGATGLAR
jgi:alkanesulfonate monooxygenase SsuD/methylene tetrahydromethanopterin reductase-like flavin-dependent oxidoreductase (luciferase family)